MIVDVFASCRRNTGLGHLTRSFALASELVKNGWTANLNVDWCPGSLVEKISGLGIRLNVFGGSSIDQVVMQRVGQRTSHVMVIDSYEVKATTLSEAVDSVNLVLIDDEGKLIDRDLAMIVNPNAWATVDLYHGKSGQSTIILCGSKYALIREDFRRAKWNASEGNMAPRFLVVAGGTDVAGYESLLVRALTKEFNGSSVVGGSASGFLGVQEVVTALASVDVAVIGCGTMAWEALCVGTPFVGLLLADNQVRNARFLEENSLAPVIDFRSSMDQTAVVSACQEVLRRKVSTRSNAFRRTRLIDGLGTRRVCHAINELVT